jgi:hypothetical protein
VLFRSRFQKFLCFASPTDWRYADRILRAPSFPMASGCPSPTRSRSPLTRSPLEKGGDSVVLGFGSRTRHPGLGVSRKQTRSLSLLRYVTGAAYGQKSAGGSIAELPHPRLD